MILCNLGHRRSPTNRIAIHVLPRSLRRVGLHRRVKSVESRITEISSRQRNDERKHDHADEPPMPPGRRMSRNVSCFRFPHRYLSPIIQTKQLKAMLPVLIQFLNRQQQCFRSLL